MVGYGSYGSSSKPVKRIKKRARASVSRHHRSFVLTFPRKLIPFLTDVEGYDLSSYEIEFVVFSDGSGSFKLVPKINGAVNYG